jgi:hypothetical protein
MNDDDLRERLRVSDPSASLPRLAPQRTANLVEEAMTTTTPIPTSGRWKVLLVAAVVLATAGLGWFFAGTVLPGRTVSPAAPTPAAVVRLNATTDTAKCRAPEAGTLDGSADFAFAGTVADVSGAIVTLTVTHVYRGQAADQVQVALDGNSESLAGGDVTRGAAYLISSARGSVLGCGYSGAADTPGLEQLFTEAF